MDSTDALVAEQFDDPLQQQEAATVGMWVFLATEVLFFGGLFLAYTVYRISYPREFALGSHHCDLLLGTLNTAILLTSSLFVALAVHAVHLDRRGTMVRYLGGTIVLALLFLALKGLEYSDHITHRLFPGPAFRGDLPPQVELFFWLYFVMTGLHAVHVMIGIILLSALSFLGLHGKITAARPNPLIVGGLYWHFVDLVWVFLYPLFYLIR